PPRGLGLAVLHAFVPGGPQGGARPLHRLLEALCDEPCRTRSRFGGAGRGRECGDDARGGGACRARGPSRRRRQRAAGAAPEMTRVRWSAPPKTLRATLLAIDLLLDRAFIFRHPPSLRREGALRA